jgi:hypothetical protein
MEGKSFGVVAFPTEKVGIVMNILRWWLQIKFLSLRGKAGLERRQRKTANRLAEV